MLHGDIDSDILLVYFVVEVPEDMHVVHLQEGVDFVDDVLLFLGRDGGE